MRDRHGNSDVADIIAGEVYLALDEFCRGSRSPFVQPVRVELHEDSAGHAEPLVVFASGISLRLRVEPVDVLLDPVWPGTPRAWRAQSELASG